MSEVTGPVRELMQSTEEATGRFNANTQAMIQSRETVVLIEGTAETMQGMLIAIAEGAKKIMDTIPPAADHSNETAKSVTAHAHSFEAIVASATTVLDGTDNEHATQAIVDIKGASDRAARTASVYTAVDNEIKSLVTRVETMRQALATAALAVSAVKAEATIAVQSTEFAEQQSGEGAGYSRHAQAELAAYLSDTQ